MQRQKIVSCLLLTILEIALLKLYIQYLNAKTNYCPAEIVDCKDYSQFSILKFKIACLPCITLPLIVAEYISIALLFLGNYLVVTVVTKIITKQK